MSITGILIILGCLVAGYWIVSSVMGSGVDVMEEGRKAEARQQSQRTATAPPSAPGRGKQPELPKDAPMPDWYIVLDVPPDASARDIQAAMKRRLAQAVASGDTMAAARIARAGAFGLQNFSRTPNR
jgi:hypothetical protein